MWPEFGCPANQHPESTIKKKKAQIPNHAIFVSCSVHLINLVPRALPTNHFSGASHAEGPGDEVVHLIWTHYVRKGLWAFYFNYPQINEVRKSNHMTLVGKLGSCYGRGALKKQRVRPEKWANVIFAQRSTPLRQNLKLTKKTNLNKLSSLVVYSAGQKYRWLIFSGRTRCYLVASGILGVY